MKKPMTPRAETLVLKTLYQLRERGHDVYEPKAKEITNMVKTYYQPEAPMSEAEREASAAAKARVLASVNSIIRRVA
jgi:hypothetical protein